MRCSVRSVSFNVGIWSLYEKSRRRTPAAQIYSVSPAWVTGGKHQITSIKTQTNPKTEIQRFQTGGSLGSFPVLHICPSFGFRVCLVLGVWLLVVSAG